MKRVLRERLWTPTAEGKRLFVPGSAVSRKGSESWLRTNGAYSYEA